MAEERESRREGSQGGRLMAEAKPVPHIDLKLESDLDQSTRHFPLSTGIEELQERAGEHFAKVPKAVLDKAESAPVAPNEAVRRETVGAANPFAWPPCSPLALTRNIFL